MLNPARAGMAGVSALFGELHGKVMEHVQPHLTKLSSVFTSKLTGLFGQGGMMASVIGSGMSAIFGPAGGLISQLAMQGMQKLGEVVWGGLKKLGGAIKQLFGGPSEAELHARGEVKAFEDQLSASLTAIQQNEAALSGWGETGAKSAIAIRDAYLAQGRSAADAERDVKRLWESSRDGGKHTQAIIEEIIRKMGGLGGATDAAAQAAEELAAAIEAIPTEKQIKVDFDLGEYQLPDAESLQAPPSFQHGTPGLDFRGFSRRGTPALLHDQEAIIPRGGGHALAQEIAAALGPHLGRAPAIVVQISENAAGLVSVLTRELERGQDRRAFQRAAGLA